MQNAAVEFEALDHRPDHEIRLATSLRTSRSFRPSSKRPASVVAAPTTHAQTFVNTILPVKVFNLSITSPEVIDPTHERVRELYHADGGAWNRGGVP